MSYTTLRPILAWQSASAPHTLCTCLPPAQNCHHAHLSLPAWLGHLVASEVDGQIPRGFPGETLPPAEDYFLQPTADDVTLAHRRNPTAMHVIVAFFLETLCETPTDMKSSKYKVSRCVQIEICEDDLTRCEILVPEIHILSFSFSSFTLLINLH